MKANSVHAGHSEAISPSAILTFALELVALTAVTTWGWHAGHWTGAIAAPALFLSVWQGFLSPKAARPATGLLWPVAKFAVFAVSALALTSTAGPVAAAIFLALALLSSVVGGTR